jgi:hypothetical protein
MNTDRFLTRVWDTEEKRMIYKYDSFIYDGFSYVFETTSNNAVIASEHNHIICLPFEDDNRFIPMQCTGFKEDSFCRDDGKLVYEFDIIKSHMAEPFLVILKDGCWCANLIRSKKVIDRPICDLAMLEGRFNIEGNKFENPDLLEENDNE